MPEDTDYFSKMNRNCENDDEPADKTYKVNNRMFNFLLSLKLLLRCSAFLSLLLIVV